MNEPYKFTIHVVEYRTSDNRWSIRNMSDAAKEQYVVRGLIDRDSDRKANDKLEKKFTNIPNCLAWITKQIREGF